MNAGRPLYEASILVLVRNEKVNLEERVQAVRSDKLRVL